jgi:hypothetical protein
MKPIKNITRPFSALLLAAVMSPATSLGSADAHPMLTDAPAANLPQCRALGLTQCPVPFDAALPPAKDMLTWSQSERVVGFRNTYRQYPADVFHGDLSSVYALPERKSPLSPPRYRVKDQAFGLEDYLQHQDVTGLLRLSSLTTAPPRRQ